MADANQKIEVVGEDYCGAGATLVKVADEQVNSIISIQWLERGESNDLQKVLAAYQDRYKVNFNPLATKAETKLSAAKVAAYVVVSPIYAVTAVTYGVIYAPLYVLSGQAFREENKAKFVATGLIFDGDTVRYAIAKIGVKNRRDKLLYPVITPTQADDWEDERSYIALYAVKESDELKAKMALCGIAKKDKDT